MSASSVLTLPDLVAYSAPFTDAVNPHYNRGSSESRAWISGYKVFSDRHQEAFLRADIELLAAHLYPYAEYNEFRTTCDFVNWFFAYDEISDNESLSGAQKLGEVLLRTLKNNEWSDGSKVACITREYVIIIFTSG
jgi:hypothetical protein